MILSKPTAMVDTINSLNIEIYNYFASVSATTRDPKSLYNRIALELPEKIEHVKTTITATVLDNLERDARQHIKDLNTTAKLKFYNLNITKHIAIPTVNFNKINIYKPKSNLLRYILSGIPFSISLYLLKVHFDTYWQQDQAHVPSFLLPVIPTIFFAISALLFFALPTILYPYEKNKCLQSLNDYLASSSKLLILHSETISINYCTMFNNLNLGDISNAAQQ